MKIKTIVSANLFAAICTLSAISIAATIASSPREWPAYGGHNSGDRYSELSQITRTNVRNLKLAWKFETNEFGESQTNPLMIGRTLYAYTPGLKVIALDGATGAPMWTFDPGIHGVAVAPGVTFTGPDRGMAYWHSGRESRLLAGVMNYLFALDPKTGRPIESFGNGGFIDLRKNLRGDYSRHYVSLTSPGVIYKNLVIVGFRTSETQPAPPGDIRAYDVRSGKLVWSFHTIPHPGEFGVNTWPKDAWKTAGSANNWTGMALDDRRGIVYVPTGSAVSDFYGSDRVGNNLFADTLLALDAASGKRLWHFQGVHHDIWDRDFSSPPSLLTLIRDGVKIDAIAQPTKQGFLYVFNRVTGEPIFHIEERAYPPSDVPGEVTSPTQPRPILPEPFARQNLSEDLLTSRTPEAHEWAVQQFRTFRSAGQFVPFGIDKPTVIFPGFDGGAEWGGAAVDPRTGVIYINSNDVAWTGALVESKSGAGIGGSLYDSQCSACHGIDRKGSPPAFPSLIDAAGRLTPQQIAEVIHSGRGRMPPFPNIQSYTLSMLVAYVMSGTDVQLGSGAPAPGDRGANAKEEMGASLFDEGKPGRFRFTGYNKFLDPEGYPAVKPPWGTLNAIDLNTGRYLWKVPLGQYPELVAQGLDNTGSENYGGPIVTAGGIVFIGATIFDHKIRAFNSSTGQLLWESELPFAGTATPATYMIDGKQYVVIATSNARNQKAAQGGAYVAFALP
jgi:quinoprotein glucose dehydrogenase